MKTVKRYCRNCGKETTQILTRYTEGIVRGFFAICTLGLAELDNEKNFECTKCGNETTEHPLD